MDGFVLRSIPHQSDRIVSCCFTTKVIERLGWFGWFATWLLIHLTKIQLLGSRVDRTCHGISWNGGPQNCKWVFRETPQQLRYHIQYNHTNEHIFTPKRIEKLNTCEITGKTSIYTILEMREKFYPLIYGELWGCFCWLRYHLLYTRVQAVVK